MKLISSILLMQEKKLSEDNVKDLSADLQVRMLLTFFTSCSCTEIPNNFPADISMR
jgi:hypothetical protein